MKRQSFLFNLILPAFLLSFVAAHAIAQQPSPPQQTLLTLLEPSRRGLPEAEGSWQPPQLTLIPETLEGSLPHSPLRHNQRNIVILFLRAESLHLLNHRSQQLL
jgi:hypothetical protein